MRPRVIPEPKHHPLSRRAIVGVMACGALLLSWAYARSAGAGQSPERLLLEFITAFIVTFGAFVLAGTLIGWLRIRSPRSTGREA